MPKSPKQKLKLLYLMQMLLEKTDETHPHYCKRFTPTERFGVPFSVYMEE